MSLLAQKGKICAVNFHIWNKNSYFLVLYHFIRPKFRKLRKNVQNLENLIQNLITTN